MKKITSTMQVETMKYNDIHRTNKTMTVDEKEKSPRFAFYVVHRTLM